MGNYIHLAAWQGNVPFLHRLREEDPTYNLCSPVGVFGVPVLHIAVYRNQKDFLKIMCAGLSYENFFVEFQGMTALQLAKSLNNPEMVHFLMYCCEMSLEVRFKMQLNEPMCRTYANHCALVYMNFRDGDGFRRTLTTKPLRKGCTALNGCPDHFTPLFLAVVLGRIQLVKSFIDNGATPSAHPVLPEFGYELLHMAARFDQHLMIPMLVKAGCSLERTSSSGYSPLVVAAQWGNLLSIRALAKSPAFSLQAGGGSLALYIAAQNGHFHTIATFVRLGCDINFQFHDDSVLHIAAAYNRGIIVRRLIELGANASAVTDEYNYTPLHLAAIRGHWDLVEPLMTACSRRAIYGGGHLTPAELAITGNDFRFLEALNKHGFDYTWIDSFGCTLLHYVVLVRHRKKDPAENDGIHVETSLIDLLIGFGCDPHRGNDMGETPLDLAVMCADAECLAVLERATRVTAAVSQCA